MAPETVRVVKLPGQRVISGEIVTEGRAFTWVVWVMFEAHPLVPVPLIV